MEVKRRAFLRERCSGRQGERLGDDSKKGCRVKEHGETMESVSVGEEEGRDHSHTEQNPCLPDHQGEGELEVDGENALDKRQFKGRQSLTTVNETKHEGRMGKFEEGGGVWADDFVPRSSTEQTRNCARVNRDLQDFIVKTLSNVLLRSQNWIEIPGWTSTKSSPHTVLNSRETGDSTRQCNQNSITAGSVGAEEKGKLENGYNETAIGGNHEASGGEEANRSPVTTQWNLGGELIKRIMGNDSVTTYICKHCITQL